MDKNNMTTISEYRLLPSAGQIRELKLFFVTFLWDLDYWLNKTNNLETSPRVLGNSAFFFIFCHFINYLN